MSPEEDNPLPFGPHIHGIIRDCPSRLKNFPSIGPHHADGHVKVVVLPAPLGPRRPTTDPLHVQAHRIDHPLFTVDLYQVVK